LDRLVEVVNVAILSKIYCTQMSEVYIYIYISNLIIENTTEIPHLKMRIIILPSEISLEL